MSLVEIIAVIPDHAYYAASIKAIRFSLDNCCVFNDVTIICPQKHEDHKEFTHLYDNSLTYGNYSEFMLKELHKFVEHDHCLTIQWDSGILDHVLWTPDFLRYDYIGAPWPNSFANRVGNGGFSLRSRKFMEATSKLNYVKTGISKEYDAEDYFACVQNYSKMLEHGINFAPVGLARKFAVEHPIPEQPHKYNDIHTYSSFGFHGEFNTGGMSLLRK